MGLMVLALALLGLGWNFGFISGTTAVVHAAPPQVRAKTQGGMDVWIALGGALSGMIVAHASFSALSLAGSFLSLLLIPVTIGGRADRS